MRLIDADEFKEYIKNGFEAMQHLFKTDEYRERMSKITTGFLQDIDEQPTVDAVEVVRCKDCIWYHKAHIKCNDGTEKDESEFPDEAFGILGRKCGVSIAYGINVGGACENQRLFINDEYQFRKPEDYCSYGEREDGEK